jgi:polyisoprenoid-binding protein YceI
MTVKRLAVAIIAAAALSAPAGAQDAPDPKAAISGLYKNDPEHAYIVFSYSHVGYSRPHIRWRTWTADLNWNADAPEKSSVSVVIDAASVDSGVDEFDEHLKAAQFFDVEKHKQITFKSTKVVRTGPTTGAITGDLTIKGVTKPVVLEATFNRAADDPFFKTHKIGFSAKTRVKRSDFGVDAYAPAVSDVVDITIETEFNKAK